MGPCRECTVARKLIAILCAGALSTAPVLTTESVAAQAPAINLLPPDGQLPEDLTFSRVVSVRELDDGRVLVTDRLEGRLVLVDFAREAVTDIGRRGEGPGEYGTPGYLFDVGPDRTLMTDVASRRWFFLEGVEVHTTWGAQSPLPERLGPGLSGADRNARFLGVAGFSVSQGIVVSRLEADSLQLLLLSSGAEGEPVDADMIAVLGGRGRLGMKVTRDPPYVYVRDSPLSTEDQGLLFPDGWIAVAYGDPYRVEWREPSGEWRRGSRLPHTPRETNREEKCFSIATRGFEVDTCGDALLDQFPDFPSVLPAFLPNALLASPNGLLVIARTPTARASNWRRYDLVDRAGRLVSTLTIPLAQRIVGFGESSVYVVETDPLGLETLRRHPWR